MTCHLVALCFDANDPLRLARFWAGVLGWEMADDPQDGIALLPSDDTGFRIRFLPTQEPKVGQNQMHFDLTSTSLEDQQQTVARSLGLGARHIDIGQRPEDASCRARRPRRQRVLRHRAGQQVPRRLRIHRSACVRRFAGGRVLLERSAGLAVGLGSGPGDRDSLAAWRSEDHLGRSATDAEDREVPAAFRPRSTRRR